MIIYTALFDSSRQNVLLLLLISFFFLFLASLYSFPLLVECRLLPDFKAYATLHNLFSVIPSSFVSIVYRFNVGYHIYIYQCIVYILFI